MIEKHIVLEEIDPALFYGANNANLQMIKALFPKLRIMARGNVIRAMGDDEVLSTFENYVKQLEEHGSRYNSLKEEVLLDIFNGNRPMVEREGDVIVFSITGRPITPRTENQLHLVKSYRENDMVFAVGPAGSGKTYTAIALAVRALKNKEVKRIILTRPAVEAGERLGFLPGDLKEKLDPYLQPLYDALNDMIPPAKLQKFLEEGVVQIAPLAYMRGRTLDNAFVILDEAQNTTLPQIKMFLTRMGRNAKFIVTGDLTQVDLPRKSDSGLGSALELLSGVDGIGIVRFSGKDIIRHALVSRIVKAFDGHEGVHSQEDEEDNNTDNN